MDATPSASAPAPPSTSPPSSSTSPPSSWSWRGTRRGTTRRTVSSRGTCCSRSATTRSSGSCWPASPSPTEVSCPTSTPCCFPRRPQRRLPRSPRRAPPSRPGSPPLRRRPTLRPGTRYAGAPSHPLPLLCLCLCLGSTVKHLVVVVVVAACRRCHGSIDACLYLFCMAST